MKSYLPIATLILLSLISIDAEAQCAMCRAVIESEVTTNGAPESKGINSGILYLMGFPYLLMFAVVVYIFKDEVKSAFGK